MNSSEASTFGEPTSETEGRSTEADFAACGSQRPSRLTSGQVVLYPTFGHPTVDNRAWHIGISGVVFEAGRNNLRRKMFIRVLQRLLNITSDELHNPLFQRRVDRFLVNTEKDRQIAVGVGNRQYVAQRPSKRNGHFRGSFCLSREEIASISIDRSPALDQVHFRVTSPTTSSTNVGVAQLIEATGLSVISDIDDTIKLSEVADRRRLLHNTFLREFVPVHGMADLYRTWGNCGAAFHYVSSSPWQLYGCLADFMQQSGFPDGSFHLRAIRLRDASVLKLFVARRATKRRVIRSIVRMLPHRKFVLVGDSGERDPEMYGTIARQFQGRIGQIVIRNVPGRQMDRERVRRAFRELPRRLWQVFESPEEVFHNAAELTERPAF